jgi:hypothetical protein
MSIIGTTNISINSLASNLPAPITSNISLTALQINYMGSSTAYAVISASKMSAWFISNCKKSVSQGSTTPYVTGVGVALNPTKTKTSANYTGWVYDRNGIPWIPTSLSDFKYSAQSRPSAAVNKIGTGDPANFTLQLAGTFINSAGAAISNPLPGGTPNVFFFWIEHNSDAKFALGQWRVSDNAGILTIPNCQPGDFKVYIQDSFGAGNQFETRVDFEYP